MLMISLRQFAPPAEVLSALPARRAVLVVLDVENLATRLFDVMDNFPFGHAVRLHRFRASCPDAPQDIRDPNRRDAFDRMPHSRSRPGWKLEDH
jgi:hypothetical protein